MKITRTPRVGDLVRYTEGRPTSSLRRRSMVRRGVSPDDDQPGLILSGPKVFGDGPDQVLQWEVLWMYCNKTGWWDEFRLEVV